MMMQNNMHAQPPMGLGPQMNMPGMMAQPIDQQFGGMNMGAPVG